MEEQSLQASTILFSRDANFVWFGGFPFPKDLANPDAGSRDG